MHRLIFGCGYLGSRVAVRWRERGDDVTVVTRSADRAAEYRAAGYATVVADVTQPVSIADLPPAETVLYAVGYDRAAGPTIQQVYAEGLQHVLEALPATTGRVIYISTTGVYDTAGGEWVDEETTPAPTRDGGRASLAAEQALQAHRRGQRGVVLRLAGIYGPGRVPFLELLQAGEPIPATETGYLNLIHIDDAAEVVLRAAEAKSSDEPQVFCVSDGQPVVRGQYYREVARRIGASPPIFVEPLADSPRAMRAATDRRVKNERMLRELGVVLRFPSYREGLAAILG